MTIRNLHRDFLEQCRSVYTEGESAAITSIIFECVTGLFKSDIIMYPERILPEDQRIKLQQSLDEVLAQKPVQYITGESWFYNLKLFVCDDVLIPRPETEQLAELVIDFLKNDPKKNILDIGTGSGCIALAIKDNIPSCNITAIDVCEKALRTAKKNAAEHRLTVNFLQKDFLDMKTWDSFPVYDVIVSNPPYIPIAEHAEIENNVRQYEPHLALFVEDESPLLFYEKIALFSKQHLSKKGQIFLEVHEKFATNVSDYFRNNGYETKIIKDIFSKERIVTAIHCP